MGHTVYVINMFYSYYPALDFNTHIDIVKYSDLLSKNWAFKFCCSLSQTRARQFKEPWFLITLRSLKSTAHDISNVPTLSSVFSYSYNVFLIRVHLFNYMVIYKSNNSKKWSLKIQFIISLKQVNEVYKVSFSRDYILIMTQRRFEGNQQD